MALSRTYDRFPIYSGVVTVGSLKMAKTLLTVMQPRFTNITEKVIKNTGTYKCLLKLIA